MKHVEDWCLYNCKNMKICSIMSCSKYQSITTNDELLGRAVEVKLFVPEAERYQWDLLWQKTNSLWKLWPL